MAEPRPAPAARAYTPTALPPVGARLAAFVAIIVGGICGGLITFAVVDLQCGSDDRRAGQIVDGPPGVATSMSTPGTTPASDGGCDVVAGAAGLVGAVASAAGVSVISVLVLRAMAEWRRNLVLDDPGLTAGKPSPQRTNRSRRKPSA
ncbi:MAG: hypothetical protein M3P53_07880 [Actinomycetota bacterium]|nr:hypothetical protein [Actinomycetota bacterium]